MIRKAIDTLSAKLSDGLSLSNSRRETLCLLVIGIASVRTVTFADAILDRLVHNACRVERDGQSMRKTKLNNVDKKASN